MTHGRIGRSNQEMAAEFIKYDVELQLNSENLKLQWM